MSPTENDHPVEGCEYEFAIVESPICGELRDLNAAVHAAEEEEKRHLTPAQRAILDDLERRVTQRLFFGHGEPDHS